MVQAQQIYETVLYADDLAAAADFYRDVMGLPLLSQNSLMLVFGVGENYLLVFDPERSSVPGRAVPSHGTTGSGHVAFRTPPEELPDWRKRLAEAHIEIETEVDWADGARGRSIYFRDPAGNSVELAPPILWSYLHNPVT